MNVFQFAVGSGVGADGEGVTIVVCFCRFFSVRNFVVYMETKMTRKTIMSTNNHFDLCEGRGCIFVVKAGGWFGEGISGVACCVS